MAAGSSPTCRRRSRRRGEADARIRDPRNPYLKRKVMRPLLRSYGVISTVTRSPASTRMRFLRILPEVWARIVWSLSSFTRNIALGSNSSTTPLNSIRSSLAIRPPVGASTKDKSGPENGLGHGHSQSLPAGAKQALPPDARKGKRKERHVSALFPHCSPWLVALPAPVRRCRRAGALSFRPVLGGSRPCEQPARAKLTPRAECPQRGPYRPYAC